MDLPELGEEYYYLKVDKTTVKAKKKKFKADNFDAAMFFINNMFKNKIEAEENKTDELVETMKRLMSDVELLKLISYRRR